MVKVGVQYRGRFEATGPSSLVDGSYDGYYLNRTRLRSTVVANRWFSGTIEMQDSQVLDYENGTVPRAMNDTFDLRQGYLEVSATGNGRDYLARVGRQELTFGEGRLIASPDWGNTNRTYDLARVGVGIPGLRVDAFGGRVVQIEPGGFDHHMRGDQFYGVYKCSIVRSIPRTALEPYVVVRLLATATAENGTSGDAVIQTYGARSIVRSRKSVEVGLEVALQRGHQAVDNISAWAEHASVTWTPAGAPAKLQLFGEVNAASGDDDPLDGTRGTFDQLYPSNHAKYGLADRIAWLGLATTNDSYYGSSGSRLLFNRAATSRDLGWERDAWCSWAISKELTIASGIGVLAAGDYLTETTGVSYLWSPYVWWNVRF